MAPYPPPASGAASGQLSPPLDPHALDQLLERDPARAAAILAAMRPALRVAQAMAHAILAGVPILRITQEWHALIARVGPLNVRPTPLEGAATPCASVYAPEALADLLVEQPAQAHALLRQLSAPQRVTQALTYAAWLDQHGMPVSLADVLASWADLEVPRAA